MSKQVLLMLLPKSRENQNLHIYFVVFQFTTLPFMIFLLKFMVKLDLAIGVLHIDEVFTQVTT